MDKTTRCNTDERGSPEIAAPNIRPAPGSRLDKKEQSVWERRFLEHTIRTEEDFVRHVAYIHYNPVKHGLVPVPKDWEYSSFHRSVRDGIHDLEWGAGQDIAFGIAVGNE